MDDEGRGARTTRRAVLGTGKATATAARLAASRPQHPAAAADQPETPPPLQRIRVDLHVNGLSHILGVEPRTTLLNILRENLALTGTKKGCDHGQCGACTAGQICSALGMLEESRSGLPRYVTAALAEAPPALTDDETREGMSGNICRCAAYPNIVAAIRPVAEIRA